MLHTLHLILHDVNDVTPLGLCVLLSIIIFLMTYKHGPFRKLTDNHLSHIQGTLDTIAASSERQEGKLDRVAEGVAELKGSLSTGRRR